MFRVARFEVALAGLVTACAFAAGSPLGAQTKKGDTLVPKTATAAQAKMGPTLTAPTAVIRGPTMIKVDTLAQFDGTGSTSAPAGRRLTYLWNFGDGGTATGATVSHKYTRSIESCAIVQGVMSGAHPLDVTLVVTDGVLKSVPAVLKLRVCP